LELLRTVLGEYEFIEEGSSLPQIISGVKQNGLCSIDVETTGLDVFDPSFKLLLFQIETGGKAYVIDCRKVDVTPFREILEDGSITKYDQNSNMEIRVFLKLFNIEIHNIFDTLLAEYCIINGLRKDGKDLETLAHKYCNYSLNKEVTKTFIGMPDDTPFTPEQIKYAAEDVLVLPKIVYKQKMKITQYNLGKVVDLEFNVALPTARIELNGLYLDKEKWKTVLVELKKKIFKYNNELRSILPDPEPPPPKPIRLKKDGTPYKNNAEPKPPPVLNLNSWQQVTESFKKIGVDLEACSKKSRAGITDGDNIKFALVEYKNDPIKLSALKSYANYKKYTQTDKFFGESLLEKIKSDGRIHGNFNQAGTDSYRYSASNPNCEQIQKKGEEGRLLRSSFVAPKGSKIVIGDFSQLHLRIVCDYSGDPAMMDIFKDVKADLHKATASIMFGVPLDRVTKELRNIAKILNFGIIYGAGARTLSDNIGCSLEEAKKHFEKYRETFNVLIRYMEEEGEKSFGRGYATNKMNGIRWFQEVKREQFIEEWEYNSAVAHLKRIGANHPIISTDAEMLKLSLVEMDKRCKELGFKVVNLVHDELVIEAPEETAVQTAILLKKTMVSVGERFIKKVPVLVDVKIRDSWYHENLDQTDNEYRQQLGLFDPDDYKKVK
jgi:DNA polymerase-1